MKNQDSKQVVTGRVRLSFVHLFTPRANKPTDEPKFSTTILLPKSDVATRQRIDAAIQAAIQDGTTAKWNGVRPPHVPIPVHDGDGVKPSDGMPFGDECKGHWVFTASSKQQPQVVDLNLNPIINQTEVYSGIYARVSIRFFAYTNNGKKGIGCGLGNVQKVDDGEPLAGRTTAADDFGGAPYPGAPPTYQQPAYNPYASPHPAQPMYPQQPIYQPAAPTQPQQYDPITGAPIPSGGVMGLPYNDVVPF